MAYAGPPHPVMVLDDTSVTPACLCLQFNSSFCLAPRHTRGALAYYTSPMHVHVHVPLPPPSPHSHTDDRLGGRELERERERDPVTAETRERENRYDDN